jgi:predicted glycoside hydrolase/deacetylase ChbG (UPF0249 family)
LIPNAVITNYFGSVSEFYELLEAGYDLNELKGKSIELMCHPGHFDNVAFSKEIELLDQRFWEKYDFDIKLINYDEVFNVCK